MSTTYLNRRFYLVGDVVFKEGDTSSDMFIIQDGRVAVTKDVAGHDVFLATLERGDFFGEMALLDGQPRHASCYALEPTLLIVIKSGDLLLKLRRDPTFALEMLQAMTRRIRDLDDQVMKLMEDQALSRQELAKAMAKSEYRHSGRDR